MKPGAAFEDYVQFVYHTLLNLKGERVQVSQRTTFKLSSGESYEVDVYYEFVNVGVRHRVAIECKDWSTPVDQGKVLEFHQKIKNIGENVIGVFVSRSGYQSGAISVAKRHSILTLTADDVPTLPQLLAGKIRASLIPEANCYGEPFWCVAEVSEDPTEGTGTYCAFPMGSPVQIPLFFSKSHAQAYHEQLPDKDLFAVFGMPQYKLRGLLAFAVPQKVVFGIIIGKPLPGGELKLMPVSAEQLRDEYLLQRV